MLRILIGVLLVLSSCATKIPETSGYIILHKPYYFSHNNKYTMTIRKDSIYYVIWMDEYYMNYKINDTIQ